MPTGERLLVVNADDLGRTRGINEGIFAAHAEGIVSSATLMVGYPAAVDAAAALSRHPRLGVGLHVALTGGRPTLPAEQVPSLVDADGRQPKKPDGLAAALPDEVLAEVRSQLERFRRLTGRQPTHLDSHHHSHRLPVVLAAVMTVAGEEGLPVRRAAPAVGAALERAGIATTDRFVERFYGAEATLEVLLRILSEITVGSTEVMCHPARIDAELATGSSYVDEREVELAALTDPEVRRAVERNGLTLSDFGHACGS